MGNYHRGRRRGGLLRLHEAAETLRLAPAGIGFTVRAAAVLLRGEKNLRAGETVSPEERRDNQRRHERIENRPHLNFMIHGFLRRELEPNYLAASRLSTADCLQVGDDRLTRDAFVPGNGAKD